MRLLMNQIRPMILNPDWEVRNLALGRFRESFSTDSAVMPLMIEAVETFGWTEACSPYTFDRPFEQTTETVRWLVQQLEGPNIATDRDPLWKCWLRFLSWQLSAADAALLLPYEGCLRDLPSLDLECCEKIEKRLPMTFMDPQTGWQELERFCKESAEDFDLIDFSDDDFYRFAEVILRDGPQFAERVLEILARPMAECDEDPEYWMQAAAMFLAGRLRLGGAIAPLVDHLSEDVAEDGQWYCYRCVEALIRIGTDDVIREIAAWFPRESWDFRSVACQVFHGIHGEFAVKTGLALMSRETDNTLQTFLANGLLYQFDTDVIEPVRKLILKGKCEDQEDAIIRRLVALTKSMNVPIPESDPWRERAKESLARQRQELEGRLNEEGQLPDDWDAEFDEFEQNYCSFDVCDEDRLDDGILNEDIENLDEDEDVDEEEAEVEDFDNLLDPPEEVEEKISRPVVRADPKVGRNEPCPCGSGKMFKNCCLNRQKNAPNIDW